MIIITGLNWLFVLAGILGIAGIVLLLPAVIIFSVIVSKEKNEIIKKAKIKKAIIYSLIPFGLVAVGLVGTVIIQVLKALLNK